jgi:hypothetical protein
MRRDPGRVVIRSDDPTWFETLERLDRDSGPITSPSDEEMAGHIAAELVQLGLADVSRQHPAATGFKLIPKPIPAEMAITDWAGLLGWAKRVGRGEPIPFDLTMGFADGRRVQVEVSIPLRNLSAVPGKRRPGPARDSLTMADIRSVKRAHPRWGNERLARELTRRRLKKDPGARPVTADLVRKRRREARQKLSPDRS